MTTTIPDEPLGRKETYLAAIAGEDVTIPEPLGREEMYLAYIAENGGGGGGTNNYNQLINKPQINGVTLQGNKTGAALGLTNYNNLSNQPKINSVTLTGNKSASDLNLAGLEGNTFTQTQKVNSAAYAGMKLQDGSDPTNIFTDFGKTGMYISDGDGVVTLAYKNIANKTELGGKEDTSNKVTSMSASSTDTQYPSAKAVYDKDANLQTQISNLQNIGRFLAIWNATTGVPTSEPTVQPYNYRTGDYYRVGTAGTRIPTGSEYVIGGTNYVEGDECAIGDVFYYDGTNWNKQASGGGGTVQDVQVNGVSVLSGGIANVPVPTVTQSTGTSTTDVMSQNAVTGMVYADPTNKEKVQIGVDAIVTGDKSIAIGRLSASEVAHAVAIGERASNGYNGQYSIALGFGSSARQKGQFDVSTGDYPTYGYNNSQYRLLTGLYDPQNDHDAATKGYVDTNAGKTRVLTSADYNWPTANPTGIAPWLLEEGIYQINSDSVMVFSGRGSSSNNKVGFYFVDSERFGDKNVMYLSQQYGAQKLYYYKYSNVSTDNPTLISKDVSPTVTQSTGTSTTDVMSQDAVSGALFYNKANKSGVQIGAYANAGNSSCVAIGGNGNSNGGARTSGNKGIAIGPESYAGYGGVAIGANGTNAGGDNSIAIGESLNSSSSLGNYSIMVGKSYSGSSQNVTIVGHGCSSPYGYSVALGAKSKTTAAGEVSFGGSDLDTNGYNGSQYRLLTNVYDGQSAHDAATVGQLNALIDAINAAANTNIAHIGS